MWWKEEEEDEEGRREEVTHIIIITEQGRIKKTPVEEYASTLPSFKNAGKLALRLTADDDDNDVPVAVLCCAEADSILVLTAQGKFVRLESKNIKSTSRVTKGRLIVMLERTGDFVTGACVIRR